MPSCLPCPPGHLQARQDKNKDGMELELVIDRAVSAAFDPGEPGREWRSVTLWHHRQDFRPLPPSPHQVWAVAKFGWSGAFTVGCLGRTWIY